MIPRLSEWTTDYAACAPLGWRIYEAVLDEALRVAGPPVLLLQAPRNPEVMTQAFDTAEERAALKQYREDRAEFMRQHGSTLLDLIPEIEVSSADFKDQAHIQDPDARHAFTAALSRHLIEHLQGRSWDVPDPPPRRNP